MGRQPNLAVRPHQPVDLGEELSLDRRADMKLRLVDQEHGVVVDVLPQVEIKKQIDHLLFARGQEVELEWLLLVASREIQRAPAVFHRAQVRLYSILSTCCTL